MPHTITILATGLAQPKRLSNGLATIRDRILETDPAADVRTYSWRQYNQIPDIARKILREWNADTRLVLVGHSWGGWFVCQLAAQYPLFVSAMLLADAVNRPPSASLFVSCGVDRIYAWRQTSGVIRGSEIAITRGTTWEVDETVDVPHHRVDEWPAFADAVVREATQGGTQE
jgi:pimeloyl-ACP methyl ester carboxylesterase